MSLMTTAVTLLARQRTAVGTVGVLALQLYPAKMARPQLLTAGLTVRVVGRYKKHDSIINV
jgi:hypothetical protein